MIVASRWSIVLMLAVAGSASAGGKKKPAAPAPAPAPEPAPDPEPVPEPAPPPPPAEEDPWAKNVPADDRTKADALYEQGNELFGKQAHALALTKYREAAALWDHPLIRFNLAVTEIRLDKILDAAEDLEKALRFGAKPFKAEHYQQALDYQQLIRGRVGNIVGSCDQPDTHLLLDGKPWINCPGTATARVMNGEHVIVGERKNYLTVTRKFPVNGGATVNEKITLVPLESAIILKYRYKKWIPWTTLGVGVGVALAGVGVYYTGKSEIDQFMADYARECINGCEAGLTSDARAPLRREREDALFKGKLGVGLMISGGVVAVAGGVLLLLNRPKRLLPDGLEMMPTNGGAQASYSARF